MVDSWQSSEHFCNFVVCFVWSQYKVHGRLFNMLTDCEIVFTDIWDMSTDCEIAKMRYLYHFGWIFSVICHSFGGLCQYIAQTDNSRIPEKLKKCLSLSLSLSEHFSKTIALQIFQDFFMYACVGGKPNGHRRFTPTGGGATPHFAPFARSRCSNHLRLLHIIIKNKKHAFFCFVL